MAGKASVRGLTLALGATGIVVAAFLSTSPIPQDPAYHAFADGRSFLGIPNAWNVLSNLPFLIIGGWGLAVVARSALSPTFRGRAPAYLVFFAGILLTAFGSAWYHLAPDNESLAFDRLPMTIGFSGLFAIVVGEFVSVLLARRLLIPLLVLGVASVLYWVVTEHRGIGDLRPYAVVQFLPMLLIPAILVASRSSSAMAGFFWLMILFYVLAKICEYYDAKIFEVTGIVSGHALKHVFASLAPATLLFALYRKKSATLRQPATQFTLPIRGGTMRPLAGPPGGDLPGRPRDMR